MDRQLAEGVNIPRSRCESVPAIGQFSDAARPSGEAAAILAARHGQCLAGRSG